MRKTFHFTQQYPLVARPYPPFFRSGQPSGYAFLPANAEDYRCPAHNTYLILEILKPFFSQKLFCPLVPIYIYIYLFISYIYVGIVGWTLAERP